MTFRPARTAVGLLLATVACQSPPKPLASSLSVTSQTPPSSLLRLPSGGGVAQVYRVPALVETTWRSQGRFPALRRAIGADLDQAMVYALTSTSEVVALDLESGRVRSVLTGVRDAALGPDGALYSVDDSNAVTRTVRRNPVRFRTRLPGRPRDLFGTKDDRLLALSTAPANTLTILSGDDPARTVPLPRGDAAATYWGDLVAVAADTAVVLFDPRAVDQLQSLPVDGHARAVVFSPSGHRLYVARREGGILVVNRFSQEIAGELKLPGPAGAFRPDPFGRWLLVHPPTADSLWLVDLATGRYARGFATSWGPDLPTVTNQQTLLLRNGNDVEAYDLSRPELPQSGRVAGGGRDLWVSLAWTPETGTQSAALPDSTAAAAADSTTGVPGAGTIGGVFLQVSSSQNPAWAAELARQLTDAGLPASVLKPRAAEDGYRVVLGPYASRDEAEATGRKLGRPFFIYQPDQAPDR
ncbi:MAG: SPOR domain-containing protein [Gemmatimonadales bacterium]